MAEILNLRRARKAKVRKSDEAESAANRMLHGMPKKQRETAKAKNTFAERLIDSHKLTRISGDDA